MAVKCGPMVSPRNGIPYDRTPTLKGAYPNRCGTRPPAEDYGAVLDSVYEMTRDQADGNGTEYRTAINEVLRDQYWRLMPSDTQYIIDRLNKENEEVT